MSGVQISPDLGSIRFATIYKSERKPALTLDKAARSR
jgi:hypothetical protein